MPQLIDLVRHMSYTLVQGTLEREISCVVYDSRKVVPGCIFVCIPGAVSDGHDYVEDAVTGGATAVVAQCSVSLPRRVTLLLVPSSRVALAELAAAWFGHPADQLVTIGVTGTKGKTTTTCMIRDILERAGHKTGLIGTTGVFLGEEQLPAVNTTPESFLLQEYFRKLLDLGIRYVVLEVSSQALKLARTAGFTFDIGVFTNLEEDHIGPAEHPDLLDYIQCKSLLFRQCRLGIVNRDAHCLTKVLDRHTCALETFGTGPGADLWADEIRELQTPGTLGVAYHLHGLAEHPVRVGLPGRFTVSNSLAAIAVCLRLGLPWEAIQDGLDHIRVKGRLEVVPTGEPYTLMIDYAHNAMSLEALLTQIRGYVPGRILCMFGCGGNRSRARRFEMGEVSSRLADLTVITSDNPRWEDPMDIIRDIQQGVQRSSGAWVTIPDRREAIRYCMETAGAGDLILLAGKGHEEGQEIRGVIYPMDERGLVREILARRRAGAPIGA